MTAKAEQGYVEIDHTADIALRIWATSINDLFRLALEAMNNVVEYVVDQDDPGKFEEFRIKDLDRESMLVSLLNDCNYKIQQEKICSKITEICVENEKIRGKYFHQKILSYQTEIKAVTFHNLAIHHSEKGYDVEIVFDV